jgi:hypothetical protein
MDAIQTATIEISSLSLDEYRHYIQENIDSSKRIIDYTNPSGVSGKIIRNASPQERNKYLSGIKGVAFIANLQDFDIWFFDRTKIAYPVVATKAGYKVRKNRIKKCICGYIDLSSSEQELINNNRSRIRIIGSVSDPIWCRKHTMFRILKTFEKALLKLKPEDFYFETRSDAKEVFKTNIRRVFFPETN